MDTPFHQRLKQELDRRRQENLLRELQLPPAARLNLSHNDYFQLRRHPAVVQAAQQAVQTYGTGSGASPLLTGFMPCHAELLDRLKRWTGKKAGLLFNSGFTLNQALLKHLPGPRDLILADRLVHHSIAQALASGKTKFHRFPHADLDQLGDLLEKHHAHHETVFVVTESVFSMDGDSPELPALAELKTRFPFVWILDEAHATGVYGATGAGLAEAEGVLPQVDLLVGTLGKSLASMGAYMVTDTPEVVDYLINQAGEFIYSTYLPPAAAGAAMAALGVLQSARSQAEGLRSLGREFRRRLRNDGWETAGDDSQIVPLIIGKAETALNLRRALLDRGILAGAVRPPTVPRGTARLRFSLHTGVQPPDLDVIFQVLKSWKTH